MSGVIQQKPSRAQKNAPIRRGQRVPFRKCTEAERNERIELLARYMGEHPLATKGELKAWFQKTFKLKYRQALDYITRARTTLRKRSQMSSDEMKQIGVNVLMPLLDSTDQRVRILAERRLAEIGGYDAPRRHEMTGAGGGPIAVEDRTPLKDVSSERLRELANMPCKHDPA